MGSYPKSPEPWLDLFWMADSQWVAVKDSLQKYFIGKYSTNIRFFEVSISSKTRTITSVKQEK